jgi:hypothetical protein
MFFKLCCRAPRIRIASTDAAESAGKKLPSLKRQVRSFKSAPIVDEHASPLMKIFPSPSSGIPVATILACWAALSGLAAAASTVPSFSAATNDRYANNAAFVGSGFDFSGNAFGSAVTNQVIGTNRIEGNIEDIVATGVSGTIDIVCTVANQPEDTVFGYHPTYDQTQPSGGDSGSARLVLS